MVPINVAALYGITVHSNLKIPNDRRISRSYFNIQSKFFRLVDTNIQVSMFLIMFTDVVICHTEHEDAKNINSANISLSMFVFVFSLCGVLH